MDRRLFVLPVCSAGTPEKVDEFFRCEDLQGACFEAVDEAEIFLLNMRQKYRGSLLFENFALFENTAHAIKTESGYKVVPTVKRHVR